MLDQPRRVALYARVSSEDQAERGTIGAQRTLLESLAATFHWEVAGLYEDDGVSGTIPLGDRPVGRTLLADARAGKFVEVVCFRIDRLARSLPVLLEAHRTLEALGVAIRSATEPFDTSTPVGKLLFQLLGSFAEFERNSMQERMTLGRDRVARLGKWTGGPIPLGYDVDNDGILVPSQRMLGDQTEADVARGIFERIAHGSTLVQEVQRLNAMGIPCQRRWAGSGVERTSGHWSVTRLSRMMANRVYIGVSVLRSRNQVIERPAPALIEERVWARARAQLATNRAMSVRDGDRAYLLRGLITCGECGRAYVGGVAGVRRVTKYVYYRCSSRISRRERSLDSCTGRIVPAAAAEDQVWKDCRDFILHPEETLAAAQAALRERLTQTPQIEREARELERSIAAKEPQRDRVKTLFLRGHVGLEEAETQFAIIQAEADLLRAQLEALRAQQDLVNLVEVQHANALAALTHFQPMLEEIERTKDFAMKRLIVELLVVRIRVQADPGQAGRRIHLAADYTFSGERTAGFSIGTPTETLRETIGLSRTLVLARDQRSRASSAGRHPSPCRSAPAV